MKRRTSSIQYFVNALAAVTAIAIVFLTGCSSTTPANSATAIPTITQNLLSLIQQNGNLSVRFYGVMTFEFSGTQVSSPSELAVAGVPITWMGTLFNGKLEEIGAGEDITDEVHGSISSDGNWIETMYYSRNILRKSANSSGTFYRVTLTNVPITGFNKTPTPTSASIPTGPGTFYAVSFDVQKYITKIEYSDGPIVANQIQSTTKYISTDWKNTATGQIPSLQLAFAPGSGNAGNNPVKPGMMGQ